jgi:hypothetical protein
MILNNINSIIGKLHYKINLKTSGIGSAGEEKQVKRSIPPAEMYSWRIGVKIKLYYR